MSKQTEGRAFERPQLAKLEHGDQKTWHAEKETHQP